MSDTVRFTCPHCGSQIHVDSDSAGFTEHPWDAVPESIARQIVKDRVVCERCAGRVWAKVATREPFSVTMVLVP